MAHARQVTETGSIGKSRRLQGQIEHYGYAEVASGWLFCGWASAAWPENDEPNGVAIFANGSATARATTAFYRRADIERRGVGFVTLIGPSHPGQADGHGRLASLQLEFSAFVAAITPAKAAARLPNGEIVDWVRPLLTTTALETDRGNLRTRLFANGGATTNPNGVRMPTAGSARVPATELGGHIDYYGYHRLARGWVFGGWLPRSWRDGRAPRRIVAHFARGDAAGMSAPIYYHREDVAERGIGFVLLIVCPPQEIGTFIRLEHEFDGYASVIKPVPAPTLLPEDEIDERLLPLLSGAEPNSNRAKFRALLLADPSAPGRAPDAALHGVIDFYGHHQIAGGWLFCGWVSHPAQAHPEFGSLVARFDQGELKGEAIGITYFRDDLGDRGIGVVLFLPGSGSPLGGISSLEFTLGEAPVVLDPSSAIQRIREQEMMRRISAIVSGSPRGVQRERMLAVIARQAFQGTDTLSSLSDRIFLEVDETILCEPDGLVVMGWHLARRGSVRSLRLRCGELVSPLDMDEAVRLDRPDVMASIGAEQRFDDQRCGFVAYLPHAVNGASRPYIEVETRQLEVGFRTIPAPKFEGIGAMKRLLESFDVRFLEIPKAYDRVIGPAIAHLNKTRLEMKPGVAVLQFGRAPANPRFSVIIPLYGRIDYVEYQCALFSRHLPNTDVDFIYVLDDPSKRHEAQRLFASVYERFGIPLRGILLDRNVGFAPANNIGLGYARGEYVCFLNSDAIPGEPGWLEHLADRLMAHPEIGVIGPLLLYEDGTVQHRGTVFRRLREFGDWLFPHHEGKGLLPSPGGGLRQSFAITGACMLMRRALAEKLGGFDEAYAIGDFEDADLCLKLHEMGLACATDQNIHLFHLERKSQARSGVRWRMNLTLYNAWIFQRRWAETILAHPAAFGTQIALAPRPARVPQSPRATRLSRRTSPRRP